MRLSLAALGVGVLGLLLLGLAGPAYRLGVPLPVALSIMRWAGYVGLVAAVLGIVAGGLAYRRGIRAAAGVAVFSVLVGLIVAGIPYQWQRRAASLPPIHDITTDLENPPAFKAVVALRADAPNSLERAPVLAAQQRETYPDVAPVTLPAAPAAAFDRALAVAQELGWEIVSADQATGHIEATDTTRWFGFKDDVVVRMTPWGTGTRVDVRSVSRVGRSDGTNARRIRSFLDALQN